ncbi:ABC transporter permease [Sphingobacterium rhinopitheci]|uniref:ABC transporter permease n=1 Tax=Sphingobacterium rhinopitheci TaxID=2781960 RepID=UPI001F519827|nr:ABC transporter permease [Sphingobacterium rhinopitheci]MCI0921943.1 ABC transporter permease [Sphingobacterium rhinopitheci]
MKEKLLKNNTLIIFLLLLIGSSLVSDSFLSGNNLQNLLRQVAPIGLVSIGMFLVILTGGIDLSVGSILAFIGVAFAILSYEVYFAAAIAIVLLLGIGIGAISGYLVAYQRMAPFIATLALMTIVRGAGFLASKGAPISVGEHSAAIMYLGTGSIFGIPVSALLFFGLFIAVFVLLKYHVVGRHIIAIGSNEEAVRLSGISVERTKCLVYIISGFLTALAALMVVGRTGVGSPNIGIGMELDAIAAVVIGGTSLAGGRGSVFFTLLGVFILGMIGNIMNLLDVTAYLQQLIKGIIIILAVLFQKRSI